MADTLEAQGAVAPESTHSIRSPKVIDFDVERKVGSGSASEFDALMLEVAENTRPGGGPNFVGCLKALTECERVTQDMTAGLTAILDGALALIEQRDAVVRAESIVKLLLLARDRVLRLSEIIAEDVDAAGAWTTESLEEAEQS